MAVYCTVQNTTIRYTIRLAKTTTRARNRAAVSEQTGWPPGAGAERGVARMQRAAQSRTPPNQPRPPSLHCEIVFPSASTWR